MGGSHRQLEIAGGGGGRQGCMCTEEPSVDSGGRHLKCKKRQGLLEERCWSQTREGMESVLGVPQLMAVGPGEAGSCRAHLHAHMVPGPRGHSGHRCLLVPAEIIPFTSVLETYSVFKA